MKSERQPDLARFGQLVARRRQALGLTQEQVNALGGPSNTTFTKIENLEWRPGRPATLQKLDAGLQWKEGSSARILYSGGHPEPIEDTSPQPGNVVLPASSSDGLSNEELAALLVVTLEAAVQATWQAFHETKGEPPVRSTQATDELDSAQSLAEQLILRIVKTGELAPLKRQARLTLRKHLEETYTPAGAQKLDLNAIPDITDEPGERVAGGWLTPFSDKTQ